MNRIDMNDLLNKYDTYVFNTPPEKYDPEQLDEIINILESQREVNQLEIGNIQLNQPDYDIVPPKADMLSRPGHVLAGLLVAASILALTLIGLNYEPIIADKDHDGFYILKKGDGGTEFLKYPNDTEHKKYQNKEEFINALDNRLKWYLNEASEYDLKEIQSIYELLIYLEPSSCGYYDNLVKNILGIKEP